MSFNMKAKKKKAAEKTGTTKQGLQFNKSFGQHILKNPLAVENMVQKAGVYSSDRVLEIGPGTGNLTMKLLEKAAEVVVFEIDPRMAAELEKRVLGGPYRSKLSLHIGDVLKCDQLPHFTVCVSNLPYKISSPIVQKLLLHEQQFRCAVLMFQQEFSRRLVAKPGEKMYCRLSVNVQLLADVWEIMSVSRNSFRPPPKVDSSVVMIKPKHPRPNINFKEMDGLLRICFSRKNKLILSEFKQNKVLEMLENNFRSYCSLKNTVLPSDFNMKTKVENLLKTTGFADKRSRTLGTNEFLELLGHFNSEGIHFT